MHTKSFSTSWAIWDVLFAVLMHAVIIVLVVLATWWQSSQEPEKKPLQRIEVQIISAQALRHMQHHAKPQPIAKVTPAIQVKPKPIPSAPIKPKATKPKVSPVTPTHIKPKPVKKHIKKVVEDPNFDPFAPAESSSDVAPKANSSKRTDIATLMQQQLSQKEIEQYIRMMQASVQRHWKVPGGIADQLPDPLVEMILKPNGTIVRVRILESSGDPTFDQTLITAIHAAAPFTIPEQQFESFRNNKLRFHPL